MSYKEIVREIVDLTLESNSTAISVDIAHNRTYIWFISDDFTKTTRIEINKLCDNGSYGVRYWDENSNCNIVSISRAVELINSNVK